MLSCDCLFATPWTVAHQFPLSIGPPRQENRRELPFSSPEEPPDWGWNPSLLCLLHWQADSLPLYHLGNPFDNTTLKPERCLLLGRKAMTNLDSILKSRGITLLMKIHIVKAMVFSVVMYGYESWTIKKAEHWRTDAFQPWWWSRVLRVPWTTRSNKSTLKEINPEYSLEEAFLVA